MSRRTKIILGIICIVVLAGIKLAAKVWRGMERDQQIAAEKMATENE